MREGNFKESRVIFQLDFYLAFLILASNSQFCKNLEMWKLVLSKDREVVDQWRQIESPKIFYPNERRAFYYIRVNHPGQSSEDLALNNTL